MLIWMNENQGFIISILTLVYVIATILILLSNRKSASAASGQIAEMRQQRNDSINAHKQQTALQLLDRRIRALNILKKWMNFARILNSTPPTGTAQELFYVAVFKNFEETEVFEIAEKIDHLQNILSSQQLSNTQENDLQETISTLQKKILMTKIALLSNESLILDQIDVLFSNVNFKVIKEFMTCYMDAVIDQSKSDNLKEISSKLSDEKIKEKLWSELRENIIFH